ncbi:tigger transposable element-derived protein 6-like [Myzus persicae]|uniref:tigger transposable element-derived protein 6-like n=1 Tax=Myzus persicae TaxID=13164 RepID=UPI000B933BD6|nr:tigger transposable element-derived protein 6-like [Myzus persicae]
MSNERNELSIQAKKELLICYDVAQLSNLSQHRAASILNISVGTLRRLLKTRKEIEEHRIVKTIGEKCRRHYLREKRENDKLLTHMEEGMVRWLEYASILSVRVSKMILIDKARSLGRVLGVENFSPDNNWIEKWKNKYNISNKRVQLVTDQNRGAIFLANNYGLIKSVKDFFENVMSNYDANDIYSLFEIGLYYHDLPNSNCEFKGPPDNRECQKSIHRLSIIFASNITGTDKMRPRIIDNIHIPRYLQDVKTLSVHFQASYNTWITSCYASILRWLDEELSGRKILVIIDNVMVDLQIELQNIEIKYLPSSMVSVHPLRQNIMRIEKTYEYYLKQTKSATTSNAENLPTTYNTAQISVSDSMHMIFNVWENMPPALIRNCFRKVGFIKTKTEEINENLYLNFKYWISNYREYLWTIFNHLQVE